jgi:hypothetical protein
MIIIESIFEPKLVHEHRYIWGQENCLKYQLSYFSIYLIRMIEFIK